MTHTENPQSDHSTHAGQYALATGERAVHRLKILQGVYGAATRSLLLKAGVLPGMRVADFGCGAGTVTRLLSTLVGANGRVIGIDFSADQVEQARQISAQSDGLRNIAFLQGDATASGLPRACFDLVYCRFLLLHLPNPEAAMREMAAVLKPDGILVCEDGDLTVAGSIPATALNVCGDLWARLGPIRGVDYAFGPRLYHMFLEQGFAAPNISIHQPAIASGEAKSLLSLPVKKPAMHLWKPD